MHGVKGKEQTNRACFSTMWTSIQESWICGVLVLLFCMQEEVKESLSFHFRTGFSFMYTLGELWFIN